MSNQNQEWLDNLQVGDEVAVEIPSYRSNSYKITKVKKITPTRRITTETNTVFTSDGIEYGKKGSWSFQNNLVPVTEKIREGVEYNQLRWSFQKILPENLTLEQLRAIDKIVNQSEVSEVSEVSEK